MIAVIILLATVATVAIGVAGAYANVPWRYAKERIERTGRARRALRIRRTREFDSPWAGERDQK